MELRARILVLCLLCVVSASKVLSEEITEIQKTSLAPAKNPPSSPTWQSDDTSISDASKYRDKRALGLLLSGLAQIFGYTVTPIQIASLPNPNTTMPAMMANSTMSTAKGQQGASSRPVMANTTAPRRQETLRFTGVVNIGNNSDILGHLRRYEQIFHGSKNNTPAMNATSPKPMTKPANSSGPSSPKPPLLTPFFVKIPLPLAPDLPPATIPIESIQLSYPAPLFTVVDDSAVSTSPAVPIRHEQETEYRNNEDTEHYTVEGKEIYDEEDVTKYNPMSKYTHRLYVDEPSWDKQQEERYNEVQRKQAENVARIKEQEVERDHDRNYDDRENDRENESKERYKNREDEIAERNQGQTTKYKSSEVRRPNDGAEEEDSAENSRERINQTNLSNESSKQSSEEDERQKAESYSNYDDSVEPSGQFGNKQPNQPLPTDFNKYIEVEYNQQLPIGDYFHEGNLDEIRDSYGEVLNSKKQEDDRISGYFSMFKHPYNDAYDYQKYNDPEDASVENNREETSITDSYNEHLKRLQKLREEYATPGPENKYEEYNINDEDEANDNNRENGKVQSRAPTKSRRIKTDRLRDKGNSRAKTTSGSSKNELRHNNDAKSQEEIDLTNYTPLVVPVRYVDATEEVEEATTLKSKKSNKLAHKMNSRTSGSNVDFAPNVENITPQIVRFSERPRQLHDGEHKELHIGVPPFDYVYDNSERTNAIVPVNPQNYPLNYYQHIISNNDESDVNNDSNSEQPSGYLVVVGNPVHPYRYPYNIYYFHKETVNPTDQALNEGTHQRHDFYVPQQTTQTDPSFSEHNGNESNPTVEYYYQPQETQYNTLDRYRYIFGEHAFPSGEPSEVDMKNQISNSENWSNRIYQPQLRVNTVDQPLPVKLQDVTSSSRNAQDGGLSGGQRSPQLSRKQKSPSPNDRRKNDRRAKTLPRQPVPERRPFNNPRNAHNFFAFSRNDYSSDGESGNASKVTEENGKTARESRVLVTPETIAYHSESVMKHADEPENDTEKAVVREYKNKVATLRVLEQRRLQPNGPTHYVKYTRNIQ